MVVTISEHGSARAALAYHDELRRELLHARRRICLPAGYGAARRGLTGSVTKADFESVLDPKIGIRLVQQGGRVQNQMEGWDMTFGAPKRRYRICIAIRS